MSPDDERDEFDLEALQALHTCAAHTGRVPLRCAADNQPWPCLVFLLVSELRERVERVGEDPARSTDDQKMDLAVLIADAWRDWHPITEQHPGLPWNYIASRLVDAGVRVSDLPASS